MKKFKLLLTLLFSLSVLTACGGEKSPSTGSTSSDSSTDSSIKTELSTEITESTKLVGDYENKSFLKDGIGRVSLDYSHVDGDTTHFKEVGAHETFSLRYYGINTPESTAKIHPWGLKASSFTKEKLSKATEIVLQQDAAEKQDSNGRYIGLVWLKDAEHTDFYCLNLLIVEQAYSTNQLFDSNSHYLEAFRTAGENAKQTGLRVHGEKDPDFDYSDTVANVGVHEVYENFEQYRISGKQLVVSGIITRFAPKGFYIQSLEQDENGKYANIYAFTFGTTLNKVLFKEGVAIKFYCKAGAYNGLAQLTDIVTSGFGSQKPVKLEGEYSYEYTEVTASSNLEEHIYEPVVADLTVEGFGNPSQNGDITLYCKHMNSSVSLNVRIDASLRGYYNDLFVKGNNIRVKGILNKFIYDESKPDEFTYQIALCNQIEGNNDVEDI